MVNITWDKDDLQNNRDNAGTTADTLGDHSGDLQQGYPLGSLTDGLVAYYPFDGDVQDYALDNDGTDNTSAGYVTGKVGSDAKDFNASKSDWVDIPNNFGILDGSTDVTISLWFNPSTVDGTGNYLLSTRGEHYTYLYYKDKPRIGYQDDTGSHTITGTTNLSKNTWYHLVSKLDFDNSTQELWLNGTKENSQTLNNPITQSDENAIGQRGDSSDQFFDGKIDDVRIYDRALSKQEIKALYNRTNTQNIVDQDRITAGLVGHWPLNEDDTDNAYDHTAHKNDASSVSGTSTSLGLGGANSRSLNGSNSDQIKLGDLGIIDNYGEITVSAWIYPTDTSNLNCIVSEDGSSNDLQMRMVVNSGNAEFYIDDGSNRTVTGSKSLSTDQWHHIVVWYDGSEMRLYVNSDQDGSKSDASGSIINSSAPLYIGSQGSQENHFNGRIQDVRIYNRALSKSEVEELGTMSGSKSTILIEDFEDGDTNTKASNWDGWNGSTSNLTAQENSLLSGSYSGRLRSSSGGVQVRTQRNNPTTKNFKCRVRVSKDTGNSSNNNACIIRFNQNVGTELGGLSFHDGEGDLDWVENGNEHKLQDWSPDTNYTLEFQFDFQNDQVTIKVNGSSYGPFTLANSTSNWEEVEFRNNLSTAEKQEISSSMR